MACCGGAAGPGAATAPVGGTAGDAAALKEAIRENYGELARGAESGCRCCGPAGADPEPGGCCDGSRGLYDASEMEDLPPEAVRASLGCGNPTALADLRPGEVVLDLGSGGGIDVLLSARRVGPGGKAYGLDMTDEMLALARENQRKAGVANAEFLQGDIEAIPLPDGSVDVIISNCVINLAADKDRVFAEAFRVLCPGGRFAVSDIVAFGPLPAEVRRQVEAWVGCVAGALDAGEYRAKLEAAGFEAVDLEVTRAYRFPGLGDGKLAAAFVRARKPG